MKSPTFFTVREVAEHYRVSSETIRRWISLGKLPAINIGSQVLPKYRIPAASVHLCVTESISSVDKDDSNVVEFIK